MRSLVLDQATEKLGYAIVEEDPSTPISFGVYGRLIQHGRIIAPAGARLIDRLNVIRADLRALIQKYKPNELVIENTMFFRQQSGQTNHAMAAIFQLCKDMAEVHGLAFYTQHPNTIKLKMTGDGRADKEKVKEAVSRCWGIPIYKLRDDNHSDALAGAYIWLVMGEELRAAALTKKKRGRRA